MYIYILVTCVVIISYSYHIFAKFLILGHNFETYNFVTNDVRHTEPERQFSVHIGIFSSFVTSFKTRKILICLGSFYVLFSSLPRLTIIWYFFVLMHFHWAFYDATPITHGTMKPCYGYTCIVSISLVTQICHAKDGENSVVSVGGCIQHKYTLFVFSILGLSVLPVPLVCQFSNGSHENGKEKSSKNFIRK